MHLQPLKNENLIFDGVCVCVWGGGGEGGELAVPFFDSATREGLHDDGLKYSTDNHTFVTMHLCTYSQLADR